MTPTEAIEFLAGTRVFVTTRERIKHPEGTDLFDEAIAVLREAAGVAQQLRNEVAQDNGWDYTEYERGRLEEKKRCISLWEKTNG